MTRRCVTDEQYGLLWRRLGEVARRTDEGTLNFDQVMDSLQRVVERRGYQGDNNFFRLISDEPLIVDAVGGLKVIADAKDVFAYIDSDFRNWHVDEPGAATTEAKAVVYEMIRNGNFAELFGSINRDPRKLCFTQEQIIFFCVKYRDWLRTDGYATFFLFESRKHVFVARVRVYSVGSLLVGVDRFEYSGVWNAEHRHRVVVPRLA